MKCKYCGTENSDDVKFCTECGQKMMRDRTVLDPFPELDEYRRVRNKITLFDEHSKPLNIYCFVMIGILAVMFICGFIFKLEFLPIFSGIFILIILLMLWANNRQSKRVRFAIGRPLVVILPILIIQLIFVSVFMYNTRESYDDASTDSDYAAEAEDMAVDESAVETDDAIVEETSFGLKDYEGFYCYTGTEEIEGYEVPYTYGYLFNGDGTGVSFIQDVIDFTWNETELHFADRTESYSMEPGKLIVEGIEYNKIEGHFITPNSCVVDIDNIDNGIYHAYMSESGIIEADGKCTINTEILTEDTYDIVDINRLAEGDVIYINGQLFYVDSIEKTPSGIININGGIENLGSALIADDESNCFVYVGMDMERSYTSHGMSDLIVSADLKLTDKSNPSEEKEYIGSDAVDALKGLLKEAPLNWNNCTVTVENGEIVEINRLFTP